MHGAPGTRLHDTLTTGPGVPPARRPARVYDVRPAWWLLACLVAAFPAGSRGQEMSSARIEVSAQVLPRVRVQSAQPSAPITITVEDVARGYVDVQRHYSLRSNAPGQVVLLVHPRVGLAEAIDIDGLGPTLRLRDLSLEVAPRSGRELDLSFRLWLAAGIHPGTYPLPVHVDGVVR